MAYVAEMRGLLTALAACHIAVVPAAAEQAPISIDGAFDDWASIAMAYSDPQEGSPGTDFGDLWLADDERFLFLRLTVFDDLDFSENNNVRLFIDTDADTSTGQFVAGIGAELEWRPGDRDGLYHRDGSATFIRHEDIRFRSGPTVTSTTFEMSVGRDVRPDGTNLLFTGPVIRIVITDAGGDQLPDAGEILSYTLDVGSARAPAPIALTPPAGAALRIATHNVLSDGLFHPPSAGSFERQYNAVAPDILHLQEIYNATAGETRDRIASWLGGTWYAASVNDCKTVSRYEITDSWAIDGNLAVLIDTTAAIGTPMLSINAHLPCCTNDSGRQDEVDAIMAFIRDAYQPGGVLSLDASVPVMIAGDLNLVGLARQLETLLTGDIENQQAYGPDAAPDPDGTDLVSVFARQTHKRMGYTWRNDNSSFWPGQLDFLIYSDSNLARVGDFILYTPEMPPAALRANGLEAEDSTVSDHLILCADFAPPCPGDLDGNGDVGFDDLLILLGAWGNPDDPADLDGSGTVDFGDVVVALAAWGPC